MYTILHTQVPDELKHIALSGKLIQTTTILTDFVDLIEPQCVTIDAEDVHIGELVYYLLMKNIRIRYIIYSGIETSDSESPCGCYGYDGVCDGHRTRESLLYCGCTSSIELKCEYHK